VEFAFLTKERNVNEKMILPSTALEQTTAPQTIQYTPLTFSPTPLPLKLNINRTSIAPQTITITINRNTAKGVYQMADRRVANISKDSFKQRLEAYYHIVAPPILQDSSWSTRFDEIYDKFGGSIAGEEKVRHWEE
jgi:hypothetical protein